MRNRFAGKCWVCGQEVKVGEGYFQRTKGKWLTKHATGTKTEEARCKTKQNQHEQNTPITLSPRLE